MVGTSADLEWLLSLNGHYPGAEVFNSKKLSSEESRRFASLWLSEGIPYIFLRKPAAYHVAREALAKRLEVSFRDVGLVGSSRIGYSLNPRQFGRQHQGIQSDLDLFVADEILYDKLVAEAREFSRLYAIGELYPRNDTEKRYWDFNYQDNIPRNIRNDFIDDKYIPIREIFAARRKTNNATFHFVMDANRLIGEAIFERCSLRIYRNWDAAIRQIAFNIRKAVDVANEIASRKEATQEPLQP